MRKIVGLMFTCLASTVAGLYANSPDRTLDKTFNTMMSSVKFKK